MREAMCIRLGKNGAKLNHESRIRAGSGPERVAVPFADQIVQPLGAVYEPVDDHYNTIPTVFTLPIPYLLATDLPLL
jgi:hypothetical protein